MQAPPTTSTPLQPAAQPRHYLPEGSPLLSGRYYVGPVLGQGGFGITYIGRDMVLGMTVAVKEYFPASLVGRDTSVSHAVVARTAKAQELLTRGRQRFLEEARALARFHGSPGVVDVRDFFEENGTAYIVMDYLDGQTLKEHLAHSTLSADAVFALMAPILDALERIHANQVIHRDISPDNIMLRSDGTLCLMDFGAAHELDYSDRQSVSLVLKAGYAPEEQYRAKGELGPWTDIYALCATMYRAMTGTAPDESLQRLIADEMLWPSQLGVPISAVQERVLQKGMAPRHTDRYQSVSELKADLAAAVAPGPGHAVAANAPAAAVTTPSAAGAPNAAASFTSPAVGQAAATDVAAPIGETDSPTARSNAARKERLPLVAAILALAAAVVVGVVCFFLLAPSITVSFDSNGGSDVASITTSRTGTIDEPTHPARQDHEFAGWFTDEALTEPAVFPLSPQENTVLHAAWRKVAASYTVSYVDGQDGAQLAAPKTVEHVAVGSTATEEPPGIDGYVPDPEASPSLVVSADDSANSLSLPYLKLTGYEVRYLEQGTENALADAKKVEGVTEGSRVTEQAPELDGYELKSSAEASIDLVRDAGGNKLTFYYEKLPETPAPTQESASGNASWTQPSTSAGSGSGSGGSGGSSKPGSGSNDVEWAN